MNLPNKLTVFRITLVPIILLVWLFPYAQFDLHFESINVGQTSISKLNLIILAIFVVASITDFLDGIIARKKKLITTFGKFADPIADKLLVNSMLIVLAYKHMIPVVPVLIMIGRDIIVDGCRMISSSNGTVVAAGFLGKLKTVLQIFAICFALLNNVPFELLSLPVTSLLIWFSAFVSASSGFSYFSQLKDYIFESV